MSRFSHVPSVAVGHVISEGCTFCCTICRFFLFYRYHYYPALIICQFGVQPAHPGWGTTEKKGPRRYGGWLVELRGAGRCFKVCLPGGKSLSLGHRCPMLARSHGHPKQSPGLSVSFCHRSGTYCLSWRLAIHRSGRTTGNNENPWVIRGDRSPASHHQPFHSGREHQVISRPMLPEDSSAPLMLKSMGGIQLGCQGSLNQEKGDNHNPK